GVALPDRPGIVPFFRLCRGRFSNPCPCKAGSCHAYVPGSAILPNGVSLNSHSHVEAASRGGPLFLSPLYAHFSSLVGSAWSLPRPGRGGLPSSPPSRRTPFLPLPTPALRTCTCTADFTSPSLLPATFQREAIHIPA